MELAQLQQAFQAHILGGDERIAESIAGNASLDAETRLAVYSNAYRARLIEALATDYPTLQALEGKEAFEALCLGYIDAHPSRYFTLRRFGRHLAAYLAETQPCRDRPALSELAAFEWSLVDAFDAPDREGVGEEQLARLPAEDWPGLCLTLHPSVRRLVCAWDVAKPWQACKAGGTPGEPQRLEAPLTYLFWRHRLVTRFRSLDPDEAAALELAADGEPFAALCEVLLQRHSPEQVPLRAVGLLKAWLHGGLITALVQP